MYLNNNDSRLYPFPKEFTPVNQKNAKWHLDYARAMYGYIRNGRSQLDTNSIAELKENRMYGAGNQDYRQYMTQLLESKSDENGQVHEMIAKGWMNVNFKDIVAVLPKFKSIMIGLFTTNKHEVDCYAYNEMATNAREEMKYELWAKAQFKEFIAQVKAFIGNDQDNNEYVPSSVKELQMYEQLGGLKLKEEIGMETVIAEAENASDYVSIEEQLVSDMFDTKMMCTQDYVDINTGMVRVRRVDPLNVGVVLDADGKKVLKAGEIRYMSISELRGHTLVKVEDGKEIQLSGAELEQSFVKYANHFNTEFGNGGHLWNEPSEDMLRDGAVASYDYVIFPVLQCEFVTTDRRSKVERPLKSGVTGMFTEDNMHKPGKSGDKEYKFEDVRVVRQVSWIVGSNIIFKHGLIYDMPRPTMNSTCTTYHFVKLDGVPFARMCKRAADDIQLANLRIQNGLAMAKPNGFAYEYSNLNIPTKDGKNIDFLDIIKMHTQTGSYVFSARSPRGAPQKTGDPIIPLDGGIGPLLTESISIIQKSINDIQMILGLNEVMDGSTPNPRIGVGVSELAAASTNNALRQIYNRLVWIREDTASNIALRVQSIAKRSGGFSGYADLIGRPAWKALQIGDSFVGMVQQIHFIAAPTEKERAEMEIALEKAMAVGKNGEPLLTSADYFAVKRMMKARSSLKLVQVLLAERERLAALAQMEREQVNMKTNAELAQQTEQLKSEKEVEKQTLLSKLKKDEETHKINETIRMYKELKAIGIQNIPGVPDVKTELENQPAPGSPEQQAVEQPSQNMF